MKPSRRGFLLTLAFVAVFVLGFVSSAYLLFIVPLNRAAFVLNYYSMQGQLDTYIYMQCQLGTTSSCETALQNYIAKLETIRNEDGGRVSDVVSKAVFAKVRLALIVEQQGNPTEAKKLFMAAVSDCPAAFNKPCTIEHLRDVVLASDRLAPADNSQSHAVAQPFIPTDLSRQAAPGR